MNRPTIREMVAKAKLNCGCPACHWKGSTLRADEQDVVCLAAHCFEEAARRLSIEDRIEEAKLMENL